MYEIRLSYQEFAMMIYRMAEEITLSHQRDIDEMLETLEYKDAKISRMAKQVEQVKTCYFTGENCLTCGKQLASNGTDTWCINCDDEAAEDRQNS